MIRNLKALGLALAAMLALGAVVASAASAQQGVLTTESGNPVTLYGEETGEPFSGVNALTSFGSAVECPKTTIYTGHNYTKPEETTHAQQTGEEDHSERVPNKATTATITPHFVEPCHASGGRQATVTMNGCDFVFHVGETTPAESAGTYGVTADVVCPPEKVIVVHINANTPPQTEGTNLCTVNIGPQSGLKGAHLTNTPGSEGTPHDFDVAGTFENIHVTRSGLCLFDGKGSTTNDGKFHIDATIKGTNELEEPEGVTISH